MPTKPESPPKPTESDRSGVFCAFCELVAAAAGEVGVTTAVEVDVEVEEVVTGATTILFVDGTTAVDVAAAAAEVEVEVEVVVA